MDCRTAGCSLLLLVSLFVASETPATPPLAGTADAMTRIPRQGEITLSDQIHLHVARNETEPFQVVVSAPPEKALRGVEVTMPPLEGPDGETITGITLYRQHYVTVSTPSPLAPLPPGDYPDALIPFRHPLTGKPLEGVPFGGTPFDVPPGEHQPVWIDIHVPATQRPGEYRGNVEIRDASGENTTLPITVTVWDFQLPRVPAMGSDFGLSRQRVAAIYRLDPETDAKKLNRLVRRYYDLLLDHHLSPGLFFDTSPVATPSGAPDFGHHYPGLGSAAEGMAYYLGERHASSYTYSLWDDSPFQDPLGDDRRRLLHYLTGYGQFLQERGWADRAHLPYGFLDEPANAEAYEAIRNWGRLARQAEEQATLPFPLMITEQPRPDDPKWGTLHGFVDIWVPSFNAILEDGKEDTPAIPTRLEKGDRLWAYTALSYVPGGATGALKEGHPPKWLIDFPPINYRVAGWLAPLYGISGLLYWDTLWWEDGVDVWRDAGNYLHRDPTDPEGWGETLNGEGLLIYPGRKTETGFDGPVASLRLKWLREAVEDFSYIRLLEQNGEETFAKEQIRRFVRAMDDWEDRTDKLYAARQAMGERLARILGQQRTSGKRDTRVEGIPLLERLPPQLHPVWTR